MRNRSTWEPRRKAGSIRATTRVRTTKQNFPAVIHLQVVRNPVTSLAFAEEHFFGWMLEVEMLHANKSSVERNRCHSFVL